MIGGAAFSSQTSHKPAPGTLPAGTAELSVNGSTARVTDAVQCESIEWMWTIRTGDEAAVAMTGPTYRIAGTAVGYANFKPAEQTTAPFELRVSC